jgi:hypothetical protein
MDNLIYYVLSFVIDTGHMTGVYLFCNLFNDAVTRTI